MVDYDLGKVTGDKGDDGNGISSIELISTSGKVKTYRINFTDGDYFDYQVSDGADGSSGIADIVTTWSATLHDDKVPSEKLAKNSLDAKLDNAVTSTAVTIASNDNILITDYSDSNKVKRVSSILASQMKDSNAHSNIGSSANASQSTINTNIDTALSGKANSSSLSTVATSGSYTDLSNKPSIPTKVSDLTNDAGFLDSSDVGAVALSNNYNDLDNKPTLFSGSYSDLTNKPSYTATVTSSTTGAYEIGKINVSGSSQTIYGKDTGGTTVDIVTSWESTPSDTKVPSEKLAKDSLDAKLDNALSSTAVTIASNDNILITDYSDSNKVKRVANILATQVKDSNAHTNIGSSASATQGTINTSIDTALSNKVDKVTGKGLSTNDFTNSYKSSLDNLKTVATSGSYTDLTNKPSIPTKTSDLTNDSNFITSSAITGMLTTSDIANNLTTTTTGKVLDASQGKALADLIGNAITYINQ